MCAYDKSPRSGRDDGQPRVSGAVSASRLPLKQRRLAETLLDLIFQLAQFVMHTLRLACPRLRKAPQLRSICGPIISRSPRMRVSRGASIRLIIATFIALGDRCCGYPRGLFRGVKHAPNNQFLKIISATKIIACDPIIAIFA